MLDDRPSSSAIVGGVAGGLALVGALIVFLVLRRKRRVSQTAGVNDDDDDMYGVSRRASGRGEKSVSACPSVLVRDDRKVLTDAAVGAHFRRGEKRRLDLVEDTNPGFVQPFTVSDHAERKLGHHVRLH